MIRSLQALALALIIAPLMALAGTAVDVKIDGMHCAACTKMIKDELAKIPGIEKNTVEVSLEGKNATLTLKKDDEKSRAAVEAAVKKAGYTVTKIDIAAPKATKTN